MLIRVYINRKKIFIKFRLPKFDLILYRRLLVFLVFGFAKYLQVSFLYSETLVFAFALAVVFVFVFGFDLILFQQQVHQFSNPLFQRLFLWLFRQFSLPRSLHCL